MEVRTVESLGAFRGAMAVNRAAWRDAYDDILPTVILEGLSVPEGPELRERYTDARRDGQAFLVAVDPAETDSGVVGFAQFVHDPGLSKPFVADDEAGLRAIYVDPDRQGEGVGSTLLAEGFDRLPAHVAAVVLEAFRDNDAARAFYESRGFTARSRSEFEIAGESYPTVVYEKRV